MIISTPSRLTFTARVSLWAGPLIALLVLLTPFLSLSSSAHRLAAILACVAMMFPVVLALGRASGDIPGNDTGRESSPFGSALLLILPYAASAGAMATLVGTPPNLIGAALIQQELGVRIGFFPWMVVALPLSLVLFVTRYYLLLKLFPSPPETLAGFGAEMRNKYERLGPWRRAERVSMLVFGCAIALWVGPGVFSLIFGASHLWTSLLQERLSPGVGALLASALLFILPAKRSDAYSALRWGEAVQIDWGTVLLFGSGISLGRMMFESGLARLVGRVVLGGSGGGSPAFLIGVSLILAVVVSEIASNTAAANMVIPVMLLTAETGKGLAVAVALAATLGSSLGFLLPVSTPANAIVFGSGAIPLKQFLRAGIWVDLLGVVVVWGGLVLLRPWLLAILSG